MDKTHEQIVLELLRATGPRSFRGIQLALEEQAAGVHAQNSQTIAQNLIVRMLGSHAIKSEVVEIEKGGGSITYYAV